MSSPKKSDKKSPYRDYTIEEVMEAEAGHYYIQVGSDIFATETGKMAFDKDKCDFFFAQIWAGLQDMKDNGTPEEKEDAISCFLFLRVYPLRIH